MKLNSLAPYLVAITTALASCSEDLPEGGSSTEVKSISSDTWADIATQLDGGMDSSDAKSSIIEVDTGVQVDAVGVQDSEKLNICLQEWKQKMSVTVCEIMGQSYVDQMEKGVSEFISEVDTLLKGGYKRNQEYVNKKSSIPFSEYHKFSIVDTNNMVMVTIHKYENQDIAYPYIIFTMGEKSIEVWKNNKAAISQIGSDESNFESHAECDRSISNGLAINSNDGTAHGRHDEWRFLKEDVDCTVKSSPLVSGICPGENGVAKAIASCDNDLPGYPSIFYREIEKVDSKNVETLKNTVLKLQSLAKKLGIQKELGL